MPTLFLVDDDAGVRLSLARLLRTEGFDVTACDSAEAYLEAAADAPPDCLVLDVSMPGMDGLALQQHLATAGRRLPIVFLTGHGDMPMCVQAMKQGADNFLSKPVRGDVLVDAVKQAIERHDVVRRLQRNAAALEQRFGLLKPREREVFKALVDGKLNKQIASDLHLVEQTVKFHRARLMEHMQARTLAELMHMAAQIGLRPTVRDNAPRH